MGLFNGWMKMFERSFLLSYIDAGTGSLIIQILIGSIAGGLLALKMTWKKLKNLIKRDHSAQERLGEGQEHVVER